MANSAGQRTANYWRPISSCADGFGGLAAVVVAGDGCTAASGFVRLADGNLASESWSVSGRSELKPLKFSRLYQPDKMLPQNTFASQ